MEHRLSRYYRARRKFSIIVYVLTGIFCILAVLQWVLILEFGDFSSFLIKHYFISPLLLLIALILITFFVMFENLRFIFPINWIMSLLIIEFIVWGAARIVVAGRPGTPIYFYACCIAVFIFLLLLIVLGSCLRHDLTLDILVLCVLAGIFIIISAVLLMIFLVTFMPYIILVYVIIGIVVLIMFVMYHAQTINGGRYAEMRLDDYLLAALILFNDYVILLMSGYYILGRMSEYILDRPMFNVIEDRNVNNDTVTPKPHCYCPAVPKT